ncbi:MAG: hypothetical protein CVV52_07930 [Spirochaetae bacterium HGW-Spirochaetae-8]|nr:MAG: hypothetical protein CVV52_07930 [Spirochaetae bacterium HGW-Spirochaetae-8]
MSGYHEKGVYFVDTNRKITFWNNHAERITGFSASEVLHKHCFDNILNHVDNSGTRLCIDGCPLHGTIEDGSPCEASVYLHHKDGHRVSVMARTFPLHDEGRLIGAIELFSNDKLPTELLKDMEELKVLARTDQLTGLANRRYTESLLSGKLRVLEEFKTSFTVAMVDIDHFKVVNDTFGHDTGDIVIQMTTKSLVNAVRVEDIVGRWGGEEFLVVFSAVGIEQLELITERLRMLVEASSIQREGANIQVTVSIGSVAVESPTSMDKIIHLVDQLMYQSKQKGRNCFTLGAL